MKPILTLPCDWEKLEQDVKRLWPDAAPKHGVDMDRIGVAVCADGNALRWVPRWPPFTQPPVPAEEAAAANRALSTLADLLEDMGYVVDREGGPGRVLGWAAHHFGRGRHRDPAPTRLVDAAPWHPVVKAWREELLAARLQREAATAPAHNLKFQHARGER